MSATVNDKAKCGLGEEELIYDIWQGLMEVCFCQEGRLESVYGQGGCRGKAANSPYCRSRRAITPVIMARIGGKKYCGTRSGENFLNTVRPVRSTATAPYKCPTGFEPCGGQAALDAGFAENVVCLEDTALCPITSVSYIVTDPVTGEQKFEVSKDPSKSLPLANFKFSTDTPCIDSEQDPI